MGVERLELSRAYKAQRILSPQRLPFRHTPVSFFNIGFLPTIQHHSMGGSKYKSLLEKFVDNLAQQKLQCQGSHPSDDRI